MNIQPGFRFNHPTQGLCRVVSTGNADRVRYVFHTSSHAVTTRSAITNLVAAGVLSVEV